MSDIKYVFENQSDAGQQLTTALSEKMPEEPVLAAIPPLGVPMALEMAKNLNLPLELLIVLDVKAPLEPEKKIGFMVSGAEPHIIMDEDEAVKHFVPPGYVEEERRNLLLHAERILREYMPYHTPETLTDRDVILVCECETSPELLRAVWMALERIKPRTITLAMPVTSEEILNTVPSNVQDVVSLHQVASSGEARRLYRNYEHISDDAAIEMVNKLPAD
ncbi:hypothetical protein [Rhizobium sp. L1K21]|uniref:hypothetical protein n=1 Tax=Rhizobium sp. L1K21 TaxID=2954933 RepID=UPI0020925281|nr:hypothetical protein [Rhizobium sp. L1K21]MCO6187846.1 hypothetical protein [Rhizobium sp. L1K21]